MHNLPTDLAQQDQYYPLAMAVDGPTGRMKIHTLQSSLDRSDATTGDTQVYDFFVTNSASRTGNFLIGQNLSGALRLPSGPIGNMVCAGVLGGYLDDAEIRDVLTGMARLAVSRGLTVAGYAG